MSADKIDHADLRAKAEAATPGPWAVWHDLDHQGFKTVGDAKSYQAVLDNGDCDESDPVAHVYTDYDAEFIAAASPDVILALLAEYERVVAARVEYTDHLTAKLRVAERERDEYARAIEQAKARLDDKHFKNSLHVDYVEAVCDVEDILSSVSPLIEES